jgi:hypothetical protein
VKEIRKIHKKPAGKPEGKRPHRTPKCRWEVNGMDIRKTGWGVVDWMHLAQNRDQWRALVNTVMNLWVPQNAENFLSS